MFAISCTVGFGLALGYFSVVIERPDGHALGELAAALAWETEARKREARLLPRDWNLQIARAVGPRLTTAFQRAESERVAAEFIESLCTVD